MEKLIKKYIVFGLLWGIISMVCVNILFLIDTEGIILANNGIVLSILRDIIIIPSVISFFMISNYEFFEPLIFSPLLLYILIPLALLSPIFIGSFFGLIIGCIVKKIMPLKAVSLDSGKI